MFKRIKGLWRLLVDLLSILKTYWDDSNCIIGDSYATPNIWQHIRLFFVELYICEVLGEDIALQSEIADWWYKHSVGESHRWKKTREYQSSKKTSY